MIRSLISIYMLWVLIKVSFLGAFISGIDVFLFIGAFVYLNKDFLFAEED